MALILRLLMELLLVVVVAVDGRILLVAQVAQVAVLVV